MHLSFLFVGHTHEDIDASFRQIADTLRKNEAETLPDLIQLLPDVEEIKGGMFDVRNWLVPTLNNPKAISKPHHFRITRIEGKISVFVKGMFNLPWQQCNQTFLSSLPRGQPRHVLPNFEKINVGLMTKANEDIWPKFYTNAGTSKLYWRAFIERIKGLQESDNARDVYAKSGWTWILNRLPKQGSGIPQSRPHSLPQDLQDILNRQTARAETNVSKNTLF